eukprot:TRINITY_DN2310_c0_g1_i1.p1 TRINITY_DN2310_c0_g1~~TRINITY_DN2310_c0_g1_i1.p1  ORF type:complete len:209 (+),score=39.04 TRINITY_DN2310_c0_g1_i1:56-682(+)
MAEDQRKSAGDVPVSICILSKFNNNMMGHTFHFIWRVVSDVYYGNNFDPQISMFDAAQTRCQVDNVTYDISLGADLLGDDDASGHRTDISIRKADAFILLYSIADMSSLEFLTDRVERIRYIKDQPDEECLWNVLLVGCEKDREKERQVTEHNAREFAAKLLNCPSTECDYKSGEGCKNILELMLWRVKSRPQPPQGKVNKKEKCTVQ